MPERQGEGGALTVEAIDVSVRLGERTVLRRVSLRLGGGVHVVLGRNGAGKTTLLRALAGLVKFEGDVRVCGRSIKKMSRGEISRLVGYTWQDPYYGFIEATVEDEIRVILDTLGVEGNWEIVETLVPRELMGRDPFTLSGGEAKRVSMASILVADQPVWLLDEPFTYLDREGVEAVLRIVDYARRRGKTVVVSTHEVFYAELMRPDTYILLDRGSVVGTGEWAGLRDEDLAGAGIVPGGVVCSVLCHRRGP